MLDTNIVLMGGALTVAASAAIYHAYQMNEQFFPTTLYLMRSDIAMAIMVCTTLYMLYLSYLAVRSILFGQLRLIETEHLREYGWLALSESFLALTIFRDEFDAFFIVSFSLIMMIKGLHWIARDRVDFMEQTVQLPHGFTTRMSATIILLAMIDISGILYFVHDVMKRGPSTSILFANELTLLTISLLTTTIRYSLNQYDLQLGSTWEHRSVILFYYDFVVDFLKLIVYFLFFFFVVSFYGIPLHIFRDLYMTVRSFIVRVNDIVKYRRATRNMDERYPEISGEQLEQAGKVCIICRDDMDVGRKLPCGHVFHFRCLQSWLERQQACPTCRRPILDGTTEQRAARQAHERDLRPLIWRDGRWIDVGNEAENAEGAPAEANQAPPAHIYPGEFRRLPPRAQPTISASAPRMGAARSLENVPVVRISADEIATLRVPQRVDQTPNLPDGEFAGAEEFLDDDAALPEPPRPRSVSPILNVSSGAGESGAGQSRTLYMLRSASNSQAPIYLEPVDGIVDARDSTSFNSPASFSQVSASLTGSSVSISDQLSEDISHMMNLRQQVRRRLRSELETLTKLQSDVSALTEKIILADDQFEDQDRENFPVMQSVASDLEDEASLSRGKERVQD